MISDDNKSKHSIVATEPFTGAWGDHLNLLAAYLDQHRYEVSERVFSLIDEDCFFVVYNLEHKTLVASGNFMDVVSYQPEELFARPWMELYSNYDPKLAEIARDVVAGKYKDIVDLSVIEVHTPEETDSKEMVKADHAAHFLAPITDASGKLVGYVYAGYLTPQI